MYDFQDADIDQACYRYLSGQPFTLWADWDVSSENRRKLAATWLATQVRGVLGELNTLDLTIATADTRRKAWAARWQKHWTSMQSSGVYRFSRKQLTRLHARLWSVVTHSSVR